MNKKAVDEKLQKRVNEEDKQTFVDYPPEYVVPENPHSEPLHRIKEIAEYLLDRVPEGFITRELLFNLAEIESISSDLSSISDDELNELENMSETDEMNDAINNKTIRELFYELIVEKNFHEKAINISDFVDITRNENGVDIASDTSTDDDEVDNKDEDECKEKPDVEDTNRPSSPSIMDTNADDFNLYEKKEHMAFIADLFPKSNLDKLLGDDIECPVDDIKDGIGCKSLKTILEESQLENEARLYTIDSIICLFSYENRELNDNEIPIEQEITEMIDNLNNNTIKAADELYSQIKGCVLVSKGLGILILEITLFDLIRLVSSVHWSDFNQQVTKLKILTNISYIQSRFKFFMTCRAYFDENDTRIFPNPDKVDKKIKQNDKVYLATLQKCLGEISNKIGYTISLLQHQANRHLCGVGELPPCAAEHLPSRQLIEWALELSYLKTWDQLINDLMQPEEFYDHTKESYPAPTDMFNLRSLYIMDKFKDYLPLFYRKGFRPKFDESVLPQIIVPEVCRPEADEVFKDPSLLLFVENEDDQRNFSKLK